MNDDLLQDPSWDNRPSNDVMGAVAGGIVDIRPWDPDTDERRLRALNHGLEQINNGALDNRYDPEEYLKIRELIDRQRKPLEARRKQAQHEAEQRDEQRMMKQQAQMKAIESLNQGRDTDNGPSRMFSIAHPVTGAVLGGLYAMPDGTINQVQFPEDTFGVGSPGDDAPKGPQSKTGKEWFLPHGPAGASTGDDRPQFGQFEQVPDKPGFWRIAPGSAPGNGGTGLTFDQQIERGRAIQPGDAQGQHLVFNPQTGRLEDQTPRPGPDQGPGQGVSEERIAAFRGIAERQVPPLPVNATRRDYQERAGQVASMTRLMTQHALQQQELQMKQHKAQVQKAQEAQEASQQKHIAEARKIAKKEARDEYPPLKTSQGVVVTATQQAERTAARKERELELTEDELRNRDIPVAAVKGQPKSQRTIKEEEEKAAAMGIPRTTGKVKITIGGAPGGEATSKAATSARESQAEEERSRSVKPNRFVMPLRGMLGR